MSVTLLIEPLREGFPQGMRRQLPVKIRLDKRRFKHFVNRLAFDRFIAFAGRE